MALLTKPRNDFKFKISKEIFFIYINLLIFKLQIELQI